MTTHESNETQQGTNEGGQDLTLVKDIEAPKYYQNRELSWLDFNYRVIAEAEDDRNPLIEQLSFLAIGSSNLDENMAVRVAGLQDQVKYGSDAVDTKKSWSASKQLEEYSKKNTVNVTYQMSLYKKKMAEVAEAFGLHVADMEDLNSKQVQEVRAYFDQQIEPAITPFGIDAYRPFPHLENHAIHVYVRLEKEGQSYIAIIPIPQLLDRYHIFESDGKAYLVFTEDMVAHFMDDMFIGYQVQYSFNFRITRSADLELQEDGAEDLLAVIEDYLEVRRNGEAVRLEIDKRVDADYFVEDVVFLMNELNLGEQDVYAIDGPLDLTFLFDLHDHLEEKFPEAAYEPFYPYHPEALKNTDLFAVLDERDVLLHTPYYSFQPVIDFLDQASTDDQTMAIKMTLYRVSSNSPLVKALMRAAKRGIQVTVLVELKARFDEENNVNWAKEMEDAGIHVLYGMKELKTHSKALLVIRKAEEGFKYYAHLGTGNYNEKTARGYTDMGLMTTNPLITDDVATFFTYLSGYSEQPEYHHLHVSPFEIRDTFIERIDEEIENHKAHGNGHMVAKMNSLTDKEMILKLYEASQAGVKIDLIVRGICCLIPGVEGLSENITVRSIVGRFLEHTRIYYFNHNGENKIYLSSADLMTRNLSRRVEIAFPIHQQDHRDYIRKVLELQLKDNTKAWVLKSDEKYYKQSPKEGEEPIGAQKTLMERVKVKDKEEVVERNENKNWFSRLTDKLLSNRNQK